MLDATFCFDDFFTESELLIFESAVERNLPSRKQIINEGPFAGSLIAEYVNLINDAPAIDLLMHRISPLFDQKIYLNYLSKVILHKPWDIHSDYFLNLCPDGQLPYYAMLIPLDDVPSRTIIFDQYTQSYTDFHCYKQDHQPLDEPIDETFWNENLSMCWPHDRQYVSLKTVMPWQRRGQLQGFDRKYYHSSDNFHERFSEPKCFISARLTVAADNVAT